MPHGLHTRQHCEALSALVLQHLPAVALLGKALGNTLFQPFQPLNLAPVLGFQDVDGLGAGLDHGMAFALKLPPARLHTSRLLAFGDQLCVPGSGRLLRGLGRLATRKALRDAGLGAVEPALLGLDTPRFRIQSSLFLPDRRKAGLEQARRLARLLAQRPDFFLSQQVSQQGLDLGIAVGAQLPLALGREHRGEEGVGAAADGFDAAGIGVHLTVRHGAIVQHHGRPCPVVREPEQEGFGLAPAGEADDRLRAITATVVGPDQVLLVFG